MPTPAPDTGKIPRVSVIIPLYNHERFVREAVQSVLDQTFPDFELIIINDGSTDGSEAVVQGMIDHRITYLSQHNQGAPHTINRGVRMARGEFVSILNSDDIYAPQRLEQCVALLDADPSLFAAFSHVEYIDETGDPMADTAGRWRTRRDVWSSHEPATSFKDDNCILLDLLAGNFLVTTSNLFCRRTGFDTTGYFSGLRYAHDYDFFLRLCYHFKAHIIESPLVKYRVHGRNTLKADDPEVSFEVGLTLAQFFLRYPIASVLPESVRHDPSYDLMVKVFNSVNTYSADRQILVLLVFAMHDAARDELFGTLAEASRNPFRTSCVEHFKAAREGWRKAHESLRARAQELREGWAQWHQADRMLTAREQELQDGWAQWHQADRMLGAREQELQDGWSRWHQAHEELANREKELEERWRQWQETTQRLTATNQELAAEREKLATANQYLAVAHEEAIAKDDRIRALLRSRSYRVGRALTWPLRRIRDVSIRSRS